MSTIVGTKKIISDAYKEVMGFANEHIPGWTKEYVDKIISEQLDDENFNDIQYLNSYANSLKALRDNLEKAEKEFEGYLDRYGLELRKFSSTDTKIYAKSGTKFFRAVSKKWEAAEEIISEFSTELELIKDDPVAIKNLVNDTLEFLFKISKYSELPDTTE